MRKLIEILQRDRFGFHSAHRQTGHGTIGLIGECSEIGIDIGDQLVNKNRLEGADIEISEAAEPYFVCHAICHYNEEWPDPVFGGAPRHLHFAQPSSEWRLDSHNNDH